MRPWQDIVRELLKQTDNDQRIVELRQELNLAIKEQNFDGNPITPPKKPSHSVSRLHAFHGVGKF